MKGLVVCLAIVAVLFTCVAVDLASADGQTYLTQPAPQTSNYVASNGSQGGNSFGYRNIVVKRRIAVAPLRTAIKNRPKRLQNWRSNVRARRINSGGCRG